jgi:hypothetical protein
MDETKREGIAERARGTRVGRTPAP